MATPNFAKKNPFMGMTVKQMKEYYDKKVRGKNLSTAQLKNMADQMQAAKKAVPKAKPAASKPSQSTRPSTRSSSRSQTRSSTTTTTKTSKTSAQANKGTGRDGKFGTGTQGRGRPSSSTVSETERRRRARRGGSATRSVNAKEVFQGAARFVDAKLRLTHKKGDIKKVGNKTYRWDGKKWNLIHRPF